MTQDERIIEYLEMGNSLTGLDALRLFGTMKLATRISEIRKKHPGLDIRDEYVHANGKAFKKYWIYKKENAKKKR